MNNTIQKCRNEIGLSVIDLAKKLSVSTSIIEAWELGLNIPTIDQIIKLVKIFNKSVDYILFDEEKESLDLSMLNPYQRVVMHNLMKHFSYNHEVTSNDC